jgi:hypothetical protein
MAYNEANKVYRLEEEQLEREQNAILLDYALRVEADQIAEEERKKSAARQAGLQFKKYLEQQMIKEAQDNSFVDEVRKREEEKVWKARDDALQAREDARNYLMKLVDEGRQEQIAAQRARIAREREEGHKFAEKFLDEARDAVLRDQLSVAARRDAAVKNNEKLRQQIAYKKQREDLEKQEEYLANKQMQYMERQHQARLAEQGGAVRAFRPLQKNNWYS